MTNIYEDAKLKEIIAKRKTEISQEFQYKFRKDHTGFWEFEKYLDPKFFNEERKDLKLVAYVLHLFYWRKFNNLAISEPTRRGKSHQVNDLVKYAIGFDPEKANSRYCYSEKNLKKFSRFIKSSITSEKYLDAFPEVKLSIDDREVLSWSIDKKEGEPTYYSATTSGQATGMGVDNLSILDDLIKDLKQASSPVETSNLADYIESAIKTREEPGVRFLYIGTRWGGNDPTGQELETAKASGDKVIVFDGYEKRITDENIDKFIDKLKKIDFTEFDWVYITIPALNKYDESTAPTRQSAEKLKKRRSHLKKKGREHIWWCVYQQMPRPKGALLFKDFSNYYYLSDMKEKFKKATRIMFIDGSGKGQNNTSVPLGFVIKDDIYIYPDMIYTPEEPLITKPLIVNFVLEYKPHAISAESGWAGEEYAENIEERIIAKMEKEKIEYDFDGIDIEASSVTQKELKIFLESESVKIHIWLPAEYDAKKMRQYELDSPIDRGNKSLTSYVGKVDGRFVKNQEDDFIDSLIGLLGMIGVIGDFDVDLV